MSVLQQATGHREYAIFGGAQWITFPSYSVSANTGVTPSSSLITPTVFAQVPLPCNVKVLAVAAFCSGGTNTGIGINLASGSAVGTYPTGTITYSGTNTGSAGTSTITIGGALTQTITFAIGATNTATQSAAAAVTAINAVTDANNPRIFATSSAGVVTIFQVVIPAVVTKLGAALTYQAVLSGAVATQTVSPLTATTFSGSSPTAAQGLADNSGIGGASGVAVQVPPQTAASGQFLFGRFKAVPSSSGGTNSVFYPGILNVSSYVTPEWDIIFPCDRTLALAGIVAGFANAATLQVSALVVPYILNPATSTLNAAWVPSNSTIGCPSTD